MDQVTYLKERVDDQIAWYGRKSKSNKYAFRTLRIVELIAATSIPLIAGFSDSIASYPLVIGLIGFAVAVLAGILTINQYQENWVQYRAACESLKREKLLFQTGTAPYDDTDSFSKFVERIESMLASEHNSWRSYAGNKGAAPQGTSDA